MDPWNLTCPFLFSEGGGCGFSEGGTQSKFTREKPPISASEKTLQSFRDSGLWKFARCNGDVGLLVPSAVSARESKIPYIWYLGHSGPLPIFDNLLNSSKLRPMKPLEREGVTLMAKDSSSRYDRQRIESVFGICQSLI